MGMTGRMLTDWCGDARLRTFGVRFVAQVWPGDTLTATAEVTGVVDGDEPVVELTVVTTNQAGQPVFSGYATALVDP